MLPDRKGEKLMGKFRKRIKHDDIIPGEGQHIAMHNKYLYEVEYPDGKTEKLTPEIIDENIISQVESEGHHYQVLTVVTDHKRDDSTIKKVNSFIKYINRKLHWKRKNCVWKLLV